MKELSVFIDESGDFGAYAHHSPYYIITMVFHDQSFPINEAVLRLEQELKLLGLENHCVHTGPIIRKEEDYVYMDIKERRRILNKILAFYRQVNIRYKCFHIEKKHIENAVEASGKLSKSISGFIREKYPDFLQYDTVKIYYDNGQTEVSKILASVFNALLDNVEFRKVVPSEYKLFQVADLLCTMDLVRLKLENSALSASELKFFGNQRDLKKNYLKEIQKKEWS